MKQSDRDIYAARLLEVLTRHVGSDHPIGMGELYEAVFREEWRHRINDTRALRSLITDLRLGGAAICSSVSKEGGGYYLIREGGSEMQDYLRRLRKRALRALVLEARMRKMTLPKLLGQMQFDLKGQADEAA